MAFTWCNDDHDIKYLHIHQPKTAGATTRDALHSLSNHKDSNDNWHLYRPEQWNKGEFEGFYYNKRFGDVVDIVVKRFRQKGPDYEKAIIFTNVRNPYDKLVSTWFNIQRGGPGEWQWTFQDWFSHFNFTTLPLDCFRNLVINIWKFKRQTNDLLPFFLQTQSEWLVNHNDDLIPNEFIRFENLQSDFKRVCDKIGFSYIEIKQKPKDHIRRVAWDDVHYSSFYDQEGYDGLSLTEMVYEIYKEDFEKFDYNPTLERE